MNSTVERTIILEPYYQIYEDFFRLAAPVENYTVYFTVPYSQCLYSAEAYGPDNSPLNVQWTYQNETANLTVVIGTNGLSSFTLKTTFHFTTRIAGENYQTTVNLYPCVDAEPSAALTIFLPSGSTLVSYPEDLVLTSIDGRTSLVGEKTLKPFETSNNTIVYGGDYQLIEVTKLDRQIEATASGILVTEYVQFVNLNFSAIKSVEWALPYGASLLRVYDSIGYMNYTLVNQSLNINLRPYILPSEKSSFTIVYEIPASAAYHYEGGKTVFSGSILPEWCPYLVKNLNMVITLPRGSSEVEGTGITIDSENSTVKGSATASDITPHSNVAFSISFVPPPYTLPLGSIALFSLAVIVVVLLAAYLLVVRKRRQNQFPSQEKVAQPISKKPNKR